MLIFNLQSRFVPWPRWLVLCNDCFNFFSNSTDENRKDSLGLLLDEKFGPVPLKQDEKERIQAEFITLLINAKELMKDPNLNSPEKVWYELLTNEKCYTKCLDINEFALRFLTRTFNECSVEAQVSSITSIETSSRRLKHETAEKLTFISSNGPHSLVALSVIEEALNIYFEGKKWHFILSDSKYFVSKVVDKLFQDAKSLPNDLA